MELQRSATMKGRPVGRSVDKTPHHDHATLQPQQMPRVPRQNITKYFKYAALREMYPNVDETLLEVLKNHFSHKTLHYVAILQGSLKPFHFSIEEAVTSITATLKAEQESNYSHRLFYHDLIDEIEHYKYLNELENLSYDHPEYFQECVEQLYEYVKCYYRKE